MIQTPLSERLHVVLAGPRNAGKSSLMNAIFNKEVALVSDVPGTTTDPVTRAFEIPGIGPASITDTPGIDDEGTLGMERVRLALNRAASADLCVLVTPAPLAPGSAETELYQKWFRQEDSECTDPVSATAKMATKSSSKKPAILVLTHADEPPHPQKKAWAEVNRAIFTEAPSRRGIKALISAIASARPEREPTPLEGLVREGDMVVMVTPIDLAAPAGRLIQPQVQTIRDALDRDASALVVKERELGRVYKTLNPKPQLVVTDSQAFSKVAADIDPNQLLTSFSILFARKKGDLEQFIAGLASAVNSPESPKVLVLESCSHHKQADDIGTVKIPRLFRQLVRDDAEFSFSRALPNRAELEKQNLIIHCGGCSVTRGVITQRLKHIEDAGVPITNYGLFLAWVNGLLPRALEPFEDARAAWDRLFPQES